MVPTKVAMAQFPDVEHAVGAVQEILNTTYGTHIREYQGVPGETMSLDLMPQFAECVELLDDNSKSGPVVASSSQSRPHSY